MSKISLEPNDSGAGTFSIVSPDSNTNRTLNLPDEDGLILTSSSDVLTSNSDLLSSNLTGPISAENDIIFDPINNNIRYVDNSTIWGRFENYSSDFNSAAFGLGSRLNGYDGQIISWSGNNGNGTYTLMNNTSWSEDAMAGTFYVSAKRGAEGSSSVFELASIFRGNSPTRKTTVDRGSHDIRVVTTGSGNIMGFDLIIEGFSGTVAWGVLFIMANPSETKFARG